MEQDIELLVNNAQSFFDTESQQYADAAVLQVRGCMAIAPRLTTPSVCSITRAWSWKRCPSRIWRPSLLPRQTWTSLRTKNPSRRRKVVAFKRRGWLIELAAVIQHSDSGVLRIRLGKS